MRVRFQRAIFLCMWVATSKVAIAASYLETFDGDPAVATPWNPPNWDVTVHSRDVETWDQLEVVDAAHGPDCAAPPATHPVSSYEDTVFHCRDHLMTALNASGYGLIYLTPNRMLDFSDGTASLKFDMSTLRTSTRDWVDIWISPYEDNLQLALDDWLPDLAGDPKNAIHIRMDLSDNRFRAFVVEDFVKTELASAGMGWQEYDAFLTPDARRRDTFELRVNQTHVQFGMPDYDFWWVDTDIESLGWSEGIVQLGHHSYNPTKCDAGDDCGNEPNTWHWDNVELSQATPFTIIPADRRYADPNSSQIVLFDTPTPADAHLRLAGIGNDLEVSFDGGITWQVLELQSQRADLLVEEHFKSYWMPIPEGTTTVEFRGDAWFGDDWRVRDISVWSQAFSTLTADTDQDGDIDGADFLLIQQSNPSLIADWQSQYGAGSGSLSASRVVPEPSTLGLSLVLMLGVSLASTPRRFRGRCF